MTNTPASTVALATQSLDPAIASEVRRINGPMPRFATDFMAYPGTGAASRLEATKNQAGLWVIDRFVRMPEIDGGATKQQPELRTGICFFDALYYLAAFQQTETEMDKQVLNIPGNRWEVMHFRDAAAATGQPFNNDGLPQPCLSGRILTGGFFSDDQYAIAAKTMNDSFASDQGQPKGPIIPAPVVSTLAFAPAPVASPNTTSTLIDRSLGNAKSLQSAKAIIKKGEDMMSALHDMLEGDILGFARRSFNKAAGSVSNLISYLPECQEKAFIQNFYNEQLYTYWLILAAKRHNTSHQSSDLRKTANQCLPFLDKAAQAALMTPAESEIFKTSFMQGKIKATETWESLKYEFRNSHIHHWDSPEEIAAKTQKHTFVSETKSLIQKLEA